jgi:hypothetical protein
MLLSSLIAHCSCSFSMLMLIFHAHAHFRRSCSLLMLFFDARAHFRRSCSFFDAHAHFWHSCSLLMLVLMSLAHCPCSFGCSLLIAHCAYWRLCSFGPWSLMIPSTLNPFAHAQLAAYGFEAFLRNAARSRGSDRRQSASPHFRRYDDGSDSDSEGSLCSM